MVPALIRVLLVEDNATDALLTRDALEHAVGVRFSLETCQSLGSALAQLKHTEFDVVLLDLNLPDSDGLETFTRLRAAAPRLPVLLLSHRDDDALAMQAMHAGAQDCLLKGQPEGVVVRAIRYAIERKLAEEALRESKQRYRALVDQSPLSLIVHRHGNILFANPAADKALGAASRDSLLGQPMLNRVHPDFHAAAQEQMLATNCTDSVMPAIDVQLVRVDGSVFDAEARSSTINYEGEQAIQITFQDVTERRASQRAQQLAASVFTHAREGIMITDANGTILQVNEMFTQITGFARGEAVGSNPRILKSGRHDDDFFTSMWASLVGKGYWSGEIWNRRKGGEIYAEIETISAVKDDAGVVQNYVALFTDITPMKDHQRQLEHVAHYDALTGLPNRVLLADRLQQAMAQSQRRNECLAVAFLDIDGFKAINDEHGHEMGDALLNALAYRMKEALREADSLSRFGGDEFVAVLVGMERATDCEPVLERLLLAVSEPVMLGNIQLQVSASIGVTLYPQDTGDADLLMRHADQAMYLAKLAGKNRYHLFDIAHDVATQSMREGLDQVRVGLQRKEFVLFYQPKVNMRTGAVIGAEALIRWQHPERGLLPPGLFLPIIEEHPLSVEVGKWVISTALAQMATWRRHGLNMPVSVNIGARQLQQADFVDHLKAQLAAYPDVPPEALELEILETSALEDIAQVSDVMRLCQAIGVRFALDDFGTGYSSLTYLKRLPAELIKIDQSFVRDMLNDTDDLAIVQGVIGLAKAFRRKVIAEGVETIAHGELLLPMGCDLAQGYGIARPMPAADLPGWVSGWRPDAAWTS